MTALTDGSSVPGLVTMPPRLRLYRLDGINIGTGYVESLSSFFLRLAHKCRVSPWILFQLEVVPRLGRIDSAVGADWCEAHFVAAGQFTERVCAILEELTGATDLIYLTLRPLVNLVTVDTIAKKERSCLLCLREMASDGRLYYPLLWRLKGVSACPKHKIVLVPNCLCEGTGDIRRGGRKHFPGICPRCGRLLYLPDDSDLSVATASAVAQSRAVHHLLEQARSLAGLKREDMLVNFAEFLRRASDAAFDGKAAHLAEALGYRKSTLWPWMHARGGPKIEVFARVATFFDQSIADILSGHSKSRPEISNIDLDPRELKLRRRGNSAEGLVAKMKALHANSAVPLSIYRMAQMLEVDASQLWKAAPELAAQFSLDARRYRQSCNEVREARWIQIFHEEARAIAATGRVPTQRLVFRNRRHKIGVPGRVAVKLCAEICAEVRDSCWPERKRRR